MGTTKHLTNILQELAPTADLINDEEAEQLVQQILTSKKIFVAGAGRSGLMMKTFAMRLMQMGFEAYVVGETVTPNLEKGDLFILGSGSGETKGLVSMVQKAKSLEGIVALVTISPASTIGQMADITVSLPGSTKDKSDNESTSIQPMGAMFEQTLLLLFDAFILRLMEKQEMKGSAMFTKHANLE
ncbi:MULTISPECIES: 6-phospho-3-hexuloisomerase [Gracilibacillus]|uniref:6-phospho-3-hexuloisomerase n=1 Tax=Gracilibacillus TaxID=74385 RepID=UPI0008265607|nr:MULTISPECIES: 6-phospho-3-hexuloisomerase [Gracilibacillus]